MENVRLHDRTYFFMPVRAENRLKESFSIRLTRVNANIDPAQLFSWYLATMRRRPEVTILSASETRQNGYPVQNLLVRISIPGHQRIAHYVFIPDVARHTVNQFTFESNADKWDEAWQTGKQIMSHLQLIQNILPKVTEGKI